MLKPMADEQHLQTDEDVEAILRLAVQQSNESAGDLRSRLQSTAHELGISEAQLTAAEALYRERKQQESETAAVEAEERADWKEFRRAQLHDFFSHFVVYLAVNGGLIGFDLVKDGTLSWAQWPILGWGIAVAIHALTLLAAHSEDNVAEFEKWRKRKRKRMKSASKR